MSAVTQYNIYSYIKGVNAFGLLFSNTVQTVTLAANTDTTCTVPVGAATGGAPTATSFNKYIAVFSYTTGDDIWVANNQTAAVPAGAVFAASTSALRPNARSVKAGDVLHFITAAANASVSVEFYAIQEG
jgi:hypothetical protein